MSLLTMMITSEKVTQKSITRPRLSRLTEALDGSSKYVLDCPFTARFVAEEKRWAFEEGIINWDDVLKR